MTDTPGPNLEPDDPPEDDYARYLETGEHPSSCRCPGCDPDWHYDVRRF